MLHHCFSVHSVENGLAWECHLDSEEERTEASVLAAAAAAALEQVEVEASDPMASEQRSRSITCAAIPAKR